MLTKKLILIFLVIKVCSADIFDYTDLNAEDPLAALWNRNPIISQQRSDSDVCSWSNSNNGEKFYGTCMLSSECSLTRGKALGRGSCSSYFHTCCAIQRTCSQTTNSRVSYFYASGITRQSSGAQNCNLRVETINDHICQLRVDIKQLTIANATEIVSGTGSNAQYSYTCVKDVLKIYPTLSNIKIPQLCGSINDNHLYVHLDRAQGKSVVTFEVQLDSSSTILPANPNWIIQITQLECPSSQRRRKSTAGQDFDILAPEGCLQYFTSPKGTVKSFGYPNKFNFVSNQDYAVCFKRQPTSCGVAFVDSGDWLLHNPDSGSSTPQCLYENITMPINKDPICVSNYKNMYPSPRLIKHPGSLEFYVYASESTKWSESQAPVPVGFAFDYNTNVVC